ncbi:Glucose-6-phosphate isomerase [Candidatus Norongarragalina meridionalis]|nr:Glucose-6-phosphate isomerase [Candidatus Norongarragalina meridionalis]
MSVSLEGNVVLFGGRRIMPTSVRRLGDMKPVLMEPAEADGAPSRIQYYMYRALTRDADEGIFKSTGLRYDVTVIPALPIGKEFNKTVGHYHADASPGLSYGEVYEVIAGEAHYLLQSRDLAQCVLVRAKAGDQVVVPPNFGHVTINPSPTETLVMANVVGTFQSDYSLYQKMKGAAYYETTDRRMLPNPEYGETKKHLRLENAKRLYEAPLYEAFVAQPQRFAFLRDPTLFK